MSAFFDLWSWWPQTGLTITRADPSDAEDLAAIHAESFHKGWPAHDLVGLIADRAVLTHVIRRRADAPIGGFLMSRRAADEAEILTVAVARRLRARGFGGRLLNEHVKDLMRAGTARLFLEVEAENTPALRLYARQGFHEVGRRKGYYRTAKGTADAVMMRRDLPPI